MDIMEQVQSLISKVQSDPEIMKLFQTEPEKAVERVIGVDLPDDTVKKVIDGVRAKVTVESAMGAVNAISGMFGKKS